MTTDELADALEVTARNLRGRYGDAYLIPTAVVECEQAAARLRELDAEVTRLREALRRYGDHTHDCPEHIANVMAGQGGNCTCGYEALTGLDATGEKR